MSRLSTKGHTLAALVLLTLALSSDAAAQKVRDHRDPQVRDHRDPQVRDHRDPRREKTTNVKSSHRVSWFKPSRVPADLELWLNTRMRGFTLLGIARDDSSGRYNGFFKQLGRARSFDYKAMLVPENDIERELATASSEGLALVAVTSFHAGPRGLQYVCVFGSSVPRPAVPSFSELQQSAASAATSGMISFSKPRLTVDGRKLVYVPGSWKVSGKTPGSRLDSLETILLNLAALESLRAWSSTQASQQAHRRGWSDAITVAEEQIRNDYSAMRAGRSSVTNTLGERVRSSLKSSLQSYAISRGLVLTKGVGFSSREFITKMTLQVSGRPNAQIRLMLAWDYDLKEMMNEDPMDSVWPIADKGEHPRPAGTWVYYVLEEPNDRPSPVGRMRLNAGLNRLSIPR